MNHAEYWLLDIVRDRAEPLRVLLPQPESAGWKYSDMSSREEDVEWHYAVTFNRGPHGLAPEALADTLHKLFDRGDITAQWNEPDPLQAATRPFMPTRDQIREALHDPYRGRRHSDTPTLFYHLTAQGGAMWENAAQPDWDLFQRHEETYGDTWEAAFAEFPRVGEPWQASDADAEPQQEEPNAPTDEVSEDTGGSYQETQRMHVRMAGTHRGLLANGLSLDRDQFRVVVEGSEQWTEWTPWQALYWKTLPRAYEVGYSIYSNPELQQGDRWISSHDKLTSRRERMAIAWYTDYITKMRVS